MKNELFLIIKTNLYVGNFERKLMAYVFGFDKYGDEDETEMFEKNMGEEKKYIFDEYLDTCAFGEHDGEYSCYKINSHPSNEKYNCDSIYIALQKKFPKEVKNIVINRLKNFCDYYNNNFDENLKILDVNYYKQEFKKVIDEELTL